MKNIRSFAIIDYVKAKRYVTLAELMERFNVSSATTNHEAQAGLVTRVLDRTDRRYLLVDRSKFGRTGLHKIAARGFFDAIVSEK